ncbi:STAS domain-containing protein [Heliobacterium gestii]|uniref:STAS domain-containing protein n=1 Tax=Heliomicrobium gestii TaxID=2699 RepID=A0A845LBQ5_HELGE|nr:STAS domain-containing protein [Heliomicrobium gestii]MBM7865848.1 rsbT antagonist protein RsbS [Heliomicrobium gestii]MZP42089.1 STAS domain-containing protein [Heliomicrobium gestii]
MEKATIVKLQDLLLVTLQSDMNDQAAMSMQHKVLEAVAQPGLRGVIIEVSQLDLIDSYMARLLSDTARMIRLMGAVTVLVGLQPTVAITMVEMGLVIEETRTARNLEDALARFNGNVGNIRRGNGQ